MEYDVIVAGVGGMGSAAVAELAARGARVLGLDRASIPNDSGSSHGVNRIIRLAYAEDPRYVPLLRRAYQRWRDLEARTRRAHPGHHRRPRRGSAGQRDRARLADLRTPHDLEHELLEAGRSSWPGFRVFRVPSDFVAVYQPDGGFVLSERAIAGIRPTGPRRRRRPARPRAGRGVAPRG